MLASTSEYVDGVQYGKRTESISIFRMVCIAEMQLRNTIALQQYSIEPATCPCVAVTAISRWHLPGQCAFVTLAVHTSDISDRVSHSELAWRWGHVSRRPSHRSCEPDSMQ